LDPNAPNKPLGQTAFWNKPADVSWGDYAQAHLQPLEDIGRSAVNTFGIGDSLLASQKAVYNDLIGNAQNPNTIANVTSKEVTGQNTANDYLSNLAAEKAKTAAAEARLPMQDRLAANVIGSGPISEVAASVRAAPYLSKLPGWLASRIAGATVGGGATVAGEVGRNESLSPGDIGIGVLSGGVVGAPAPGRGGALAAPVSEADLRASAKQAFAPLDEYVFHGPSQIKPALDSVTNTMTQAEQDLAKQTMAKVNKLADTNLATGSDIQSYQQVFRDLSTSSVKADREYAPQFKKALETVMRGAPYGRNLTPGKGMSLQLPGSWGGTGLRTGGAAEARDAGDVFHGMAEDVNRLDDPNKGWLAQSQVKGGPDVGNQISSWLRTGEGQQYAPRPAPGARPNAYTAYNTVAGTAAKPDTIPWYVKHFMIAPALGIGTTEAINAATGQEHQSPMARLAEDLTVGGGLALGTLGYRGLTSRLNRLEQQRAIDALRSTISRGNYQAPIQPATPLRDWVRQFIYSQGAANRLPGQ
jgi:gas vesicle protein